MKMAFVSVVTLARIILALASVVCALHQQWVAAMVLFYLCVATDLIDGQLARYWQVTSRFGQVADASADIIMFWIFAGGVYIYTCQRNPFFQEWGGQIAMVVAGYGICGIGLLAIESSVFRQLLRWWYRVGNFWIGAGGVVLYGLWLAVHLGKVAVALLVFATVGMWWLRVYKKVWTRTNLDLVFAPDD